MLVFLDVGGVELAFLAQDGGADEGAHSGGQQRDVRVDVRPGSQAGLKNNNIELLSQTGRKVCL